MSCRVNPLPQTGITLLETIAVLAVCSILVVVGIPTMSRLLAATRLTTESHTMLRSLHRARSDAVMRGERTVICASQDLSSCDDSTAWSVGYLVFADLDGDRARDADEPLLHVHQVQDGVLILTSAGRRTITYQSTGMSPGSNLTITLCDVTGQVPPRAVIVSQTGRPREDDKRPDGTALSCPG
jgi:type IV fimbrial biogenesis protein FimT